jgi:hypothetical protein
MTVPYFAKRRDSRRWICPAPGQTSAEELRSSLMGVLNVSQKICLTPLLLLLTGCWWNSKAASTPNPQAIAPSLQAPPQPAVTIPPPAPFQVQATDLNAVVAGLLQAHGPVPVTTQTTIQVPYTVCLPVPMAARLNAQAPPDCHQASQPVQQKNTVQSILTASNIRIASNTAMTFGNLTQTTLPDELTAASQDVCNPTPTTGSQNASYSQQVQHNESSTLTHTVTNSLSDTISGGFKLPIGLSLSNSLQIGSSNTTSTAALTGSALTQTLSLQVTEQIPAQSRYGIEFLITPSQFSVPFSVNVTIDADLSPNDAGLTHLSQIVDAPSRTFLIDGTVSSTIGLAGHANFVQLPFNVQNCPGSSITVTQLMFAPSMQVAPVVK